MVRVLCSHFSRPGDCAKHREYMALALILDVLQRALRLGPTEAGCRDEEGVRINSHRGCAAENGPYGCRIFRRQGSVAACANQRGLDAIEAVRELLAAAEYTRVVFVIRRGPPNQTQTRSPNSYTNQSQ